MTEFGESNGVQALLAKGLFMDEWGLGIQELACFILVALAAASLGFRFYVAVLVRPLSALLLRIGQVKWAKKLQALHLRNSTSGCGSCSSHPSPSKDKTGSIRGCS